MAKTKPRSKRNARMKRQARLRAARESRREAQAIRAGERRLDELFGDGTRPKHAAELIHQEFDGGALPAGTSHMFAIASSAERAHEVSGELTGLAPDSLSALTLAADIACQLDSDDRRASTIIDRALEVTEAEGERIVLAGHLVRLGRVPDALEIVERRLLEEPEDSSAQVIRAAALGIADERLAAEAADEMLPAECPCCSGRMWADCCRLAEAAAISRFADHGGLDRVRAAVNRFVDSDRELRSAVAEHLSECAQLTDTRLDGIAAEHALLVGLEDENGDDPRFDTSSPLARFAFHPATPSADAASARRWLEHCTYGLWQLHRPVGQPGVWLTELVSGVSRYAALPSGLLEAASTWSVLLGPLIAIDGTWRAGAGMMLLRPREADAAVDLVQELVYMVASTTSGKPRTRPPGRQDTIKPHGVLAGITEPASPEVAQFMSHVIGSGVPQLAELIEELRTSAPRLVNTDKHPLCLIKATISVEHAPAAIEQLGEHPDFDTDDDVIRWWGRELDPLERETSMAELRAKLGERGEDVGPVDPDEPQRWIRGTLSVSNDGQLDVDVNSRERLELLLDRLRGAGQAPQIIKQLVIDPAQDMAPLRFDSMVPLDVSAEAKEAWLRRWPDQQLPALGGLTPRRATRTDHGTELLEALLRELEHDADRLARVGHPAVDIGRLREELDMPVSTFA
jgi:hypothetical protein